MTAVSVGRHDESSYNQGGICRGGGTTVRVLVTEFRGTGLDGLFCADVLRPLDLVPLTDFIYKYNPCPKTRARGVKVWVMAGRLSRAFKSALRRRTSCYSEVEQLLFDSSIR